MEEIKRKLTERRYAVPFILITTLFFLWGFARAILDVLNKHFQEELHIGITESAMVQVTTYLGYFLTAIPAGIYINRHGYRSGVVLGLTLFAAGALLFVPSSMIGTFGMFLMSLFVIGCGLTFLETAANPYVTELGPKETSSSRLNLSQTFNGMGCFMATLLVGQFLFPEEGASGDVALPYGLMGCLTLVIAVIFTQIELPEIVHDEPEDKPREAGISALWKHKLFIFGLIALLAYEVSEISINSYFVNFVTGTGLMNNNGASLVISFALVIFMVGRFLGSAIMRYVRAEAMLTACALGTVGCMTLVLLDLGTVSLVALIANYLFEAIMFPTIFSLAVRGLGNLTKSGSSLLMMTPVGGCGFLLMGYVAEHTNFITPFFIPLIGYAVVLAYGARLLKIKNFVN